MSDYKEKIKRKSDSLKTAVDQIIGGVNAPNEFKAPENIGLDANLMSKEVSEQERFRRAYRNQHKKTPDDIEISAPQEYAPEDIVVQERKYGYFSNTKKSRIRSASAHKEAWKASMDNYTANSAQAGYDFGVSDHATEDTLDLMMSTRRFVAAESKKAELAASIITEDALNALKQKNELHAGILSDYRTVIMNLGPSLETVPNEREAETGEISFTEESVEAYKAFLRFAASDPIGAIESAVTDTLHTLTAFPERMLGVKAIPQTFDRVMQGRNRFNAINKLRRLRQQPKDVKDDDPLGALMTKLYPREDEAADKKNDHKAGHGHDEKSNFKLINYLETAINSDLTAILDKAGITYKEGLFGEKNTAVNIVKKKSKFIETDGNSSKEMIEAVKKGLGAESEDTREEKRKLNAGYWRSRENAAYKCVEDKRKAENREGKKVDSYNILLAVNKIKTEAAGKQKVKYNTALAGELEERIGRISASIDELKFKVDAGDEALMLDQVKMSRELTGRMKASYERAQYDLFNLLERAKGYLNAYDHLVSGKRLDTHGSAIMDEIKNSRTYNDGQNDWINIPDSKLDTRYNTDNVRRMNDVANAEALVPEPETESDLDTVKQLKNALAELDKDSSRLLNEVRNITPANKNEIIDKLIRFRGDYYRSLKLVNFKLKNTENKGALSALRDSFASKEDKDEFALEYFNTLSKCNFLNQYAEMFRLDNIIGTFTGDELPGEIELKDTEKVNGQHRGVKWFKDQKARVKKLMDVSLKTVTDHEQKKMTKAAGMNLFDPDPEAGDEEELTALESLMEKAVINGINNTKYTQPVQQPIQQPKDQEQGADDEEEIEIIERPVIRVQRLHRDEQPPAYAKRVTSRFALEIINENSLTSTTDFVQFLRGQLGQLNGINKVTWDELKAESKAWLVGRELVQKSTGQKVVITNDNVDGLIDELRQEMIADEDVADASKYTEEDDAHYTDPEENPQFVAGGIENLLHLAIHQNSMASCETFVKSKVSANAVSPDVQKNFLKAYKAKFESDVAKEYKDGHKVEREDISIPEKDYHHVKWFLTYFPKNVTSMDELTAFRKDWSRKLGYDMLKGRAIDTKTYRKLTCILDTWKSAIETTITLPKIQAMKTNLNKVNLKNKVPDTAVPNTEETMPNVRQWYGASCWATSAGIMSGWYMKNVLKRENPALIDQMTFLDPTNVVLNPYAEKKLADSSKDSNNVQGVKGEVDDIRSFMKPAGRVGNVMTAADVMLAHMSDTAVRHVRLNIPKNDSYFDMSKMDKKTKSKIVKLFYDRIANILNENKGPISLLIPGHYRTIIGFEGGKLKCRDSGMENGEVSSLISVDDFVDLWDRSVGWANGAHAIELVYLQNLNGESKEQLKQKYGYEYNENGELRYDKNKEKIDAESPENMIHNLGVLYEAPPVESDNVLDRYIKDAIYVPKNLDHDINKEKVKQEMEQTRRQLGLPDVTEDELEARRLQKAQFDELAINKRAEKAREWELTAVKSTKKKTEQKKVLTPEELKKQKEEAEKFLKDNDFQILGNKNQAEQIGEQYKADNDLYRAKGIFGDKFTEQEKDELVKKTRNFSKLVGDSIELSAKEKKVKPTALDVINADYSVKETELLEGKTQNKPAFGWILSPADMQKVEGLLSKDGNAFANKIIENKESKLKQRNQAVEAIKKQDISKFNHLPPMLKEYYGRKSLDAFFAGNRYYQKGIIPPLSKLTEEEKTRLTAKTRDPIFRAAINMIISRKAKDAKGNEAWKYAKKYDEFLNRQLILQTLAPMEEEDEQRLRTEDVKLKKSKYDGRQTPDEMIANNMTKQKHFAKIMFLMQLGRFDRIDTDNEGNETRSMYDQSISEALAHGNRVGISLPSGTKEEQDALYNAWKGNAGDLMYSRFATHDFHRRKVKDKNSSFKEVKLWPKLKGALSYVFKLDKKSKPTSVQHNYGLDIALGGLGKSFNGSVIDDQGRFAHMYQKMKKGDENTCAGLLVGIENSAPGGTRFISKQFGGYDGTSCIGELHNGKAISHGQSAFFSSKTSIGDQYSGRVVDLSHINAGVLTQIITAFDQKYSEIQTAANAKITVDPRQKNQYAGAVRRRDQAREKLKKLNLILSGRILTGQELFELLEILKIPSAKHVVEALRSGEGASYTSDVKKYPKKMYESKRKNDQEVEKLLEQYKDMSVDDEQNIVGENDDDDNNGGQP